jgi:DNA-binding NtrC family response regulator
LDGYRVGEAATAAEVLERRDWSDYLAILLDRRLPDGTAADLLPHRRQVTPESAVIVVTGFNDVAGAIEALRCIPKLRRRLLSGQRRSRGLPALHQAR